MTTPVERVQEYLRQRKPQSHDLGNVIHNIWTDSRAEMASLTIDDLEAVLRQAARPKALDYPQLIEITPKTYGAGSTKVQKLIAEFVNAGVMAVVVVQPQREEG